MLQTRLALVAATAAGAVGCVETPKYLYAPEGATVVRGGAPAEIVRVPPEAPQGSVEVASRGITNMPTRGGGTVRALDVRMVVDNEGDAQPWTIDTRELMIDVPGAGQARPMFVRSDFQPLPTISVGQHERRTIDLFYPLPPGRASIQRLPQFDFLWQVTTPERSFADRAHLQRIEANAPEVAYGTEPAPYYAYGWGPYWWYDPFFPVYGARFGAFAGPRFAGGFRGGGFRGGGHGGGHGGHR